MSAMVEDPDAIGACGLVLAEMLKGNEWSIWVSIQTIYSISSAHGEQYLYQ